MTKIYTPTETHRIMQAMKRVTEANNGYACIGQNQTTIEALRAAGFVVVPCVNMFGQPDYRAFTQAGYAAEIAEARKAWRKEMRSADDEREAAFVAAYEKAYIFD